MKINFFIKKYFGTNSITYSKDRKDFAIFDIRLLEFRTNYSSWKSDSVYDIKLILFQIQILCVMIHLSINLPSYKMNIWNDEKKIGRNN